MSSFIAWLDYSERDRRKALDLIDLFKEQDTRDELGVGTIGGAISDRLFPGISTIQTRARYFLFVPWTYLELERKRVRAADAARVARKEEVALIEALVKAGDREGIIGIDKKAALQRLPSNIYWFGLKVLGLRFFVGNQDQYHRSLDSRYRANARRPAADDDADEPRVSANWHPAIPPRPVGFPDGATFKLAAAEADYLRERFLLCAPRTLLAYLVGESRPSAVGFPWEHPDAARFPPSIAEELVHARNFSEVIRGAALLYNLMLSEKANQAERVEEYRLRVAEWTAELVPRGSVLRQWDRARFWQLVPTTPLRTRAFVDAWLGLVLPTEGRQEIVAPELLLESEHARELIRQRELHLKRKQARLENPSALKLWNGAAGTGQFGYRWFRAQTIVNDILNGLKEGSSGA